MADGIFDMKVRAGNGKEISMSDYKGKLLLIVNTASKCGFTPQYKGLEKLYEQYKDSGLVILGFPCDQFAHQEPLSDAENAQFCQLNFGVTFPIMAKIQVNGKDADPLFKFLKMATPSMMGSSIKWNFTKFLVSKDGKRIKRYAPKTEPKNIEDDIRESLA